MLVEFRVKNYRSIREEQRLSFVASKDSTLRDSHCIATGNAVVPHLLRSAVVYGPNASGKSNLIFALWTMQQLVLTSIQKVMDTTENVVDPCTAHFTPFRLDAESHQEPVEFEVTLLLDGIRYQYGFAFTAERIQAEWLLVYKTARPQCWFERRYDDELAGYDWTFSPSFKGFKRDKDLWKRSTRPQALFLTVAIQNNNQQLLPLFHWFAQGLIVLPANAPINLWPLMQRLGDPAYKASVLDLLRSADTAIGDLQVKKEKQRSILFKLAPGKPPEIQAPTEDDVDKIFFGHATEDGRTIWLDGQFESSGTQRFLAYIGPLLDIMANGKLLVVDELDASLHPLLSRAVLRALHDPALAAKKTQLWVTTHDTSLLDPELLRRDQIWFVKKDRAQTTHLYPLSDFSPRKYEALGRGYLDGRYGALPFLSDFRF
jgi:hypothetical protein